MTDLDDRPASRPRSRKKVVWAFVAVVLVIGIAVGLALFQPWRLFTRSTVDEALPVAPAGASSPPSVAGGDTTVDETGAAPVDATAGAAANSPGTSAPSPDATAAAAAPGTVPAGQRTPAPAIAAPVTPPGAAAPAIPKPVQPTRLASGSFVDGEHATTGTASILELPDGSRYVRLEGFSTSDGPDVQVWVTDQQAGGDDWGKYDDGRYVELGALKGTDGNQNYEVPADADLSGLASVVIWCDRFNVAFGSAAVEL